MSLERFADETARRIREKRKAEAREKAAAQSEKAGYLDGVPPLYPMPYPDLHIVEAMDAHRKEIYEAFVFGRSEPSPKTFREQVDEALKKLGPDSEWKHFIIKGLPSNVYGSSDKDNG